MNFDAWNMNFRNVMSFSTSLHKLRVNNLRVTSSFNTNHHNKNHNQTKANGCSVARAGALSQNRIKK